MKPIIVKYPPMGLVRPELLKAYKKTVGLTRRPGTFYGAGKERPSVQQENEVLSSIIHPIPVREVARFRTHGITNIKLDVNYANVEFVVDLGPLIQIRRPQYAWFSVQKPGRLCLVVSDGKQAPKQTAEVIDQKRDIQGLRIVLIPKSRTQVPVPYEASLTPLYLN